jgi:hypothetical protein
MKSASLRHISGRPRDPNAPLRPGMKMPDQGAATRVYVVSRPDLQGVRGDYFEAGNRLTPGGPHRGHVALANRLWTVSADMTADYLGSEGLRRAICLHPSPG